jgi:hypothetical protein
MHKELQRWIESRLFDVMNPQMPMIQSRPVINLIRMKLMKMIYRIKTE